MSDIDNHAAYPVVTEDEQAGAAATLIMRAFDAWYATNTRTPGCIDCCREGVPLGYKLRCWPCEMKAEASISRMMTRSDFKGATRDPHWARRGYEDYESLRDRNAGGVTWRLR